MNLFHLIAHTLTAMASIAITLSIVLAAGPAGLPTGIVTIDATEAVLRFIAPTAFETRPIEEILEGGRR